jgi:predicted type IV restriction endonuclease
VEAEQEGGLVTTLRETLDQVRRRISRHASRGINEQNTKAALVEPVLRVLGWDLEDLEEVNREYKRKRQDKPVDYALLVLRTPRLFIEAKALGRNLEERKWANQIMGYAAVAGVEWVALTDGNEYRLYNSHATVDVDKKLFRAVRLTDEGSAAEETLALLSKEQMRENRIEVLWKAHFVDRQVKAVLDSLFSGDPDPSLIRLLRRRTKDLSWKEIQASLARAQIQTDFPVEPTPPDPKKPGGKGGDRPHRVTLKDLIKAGLIRPPLKLEREYLGHRLTAQVEPDGTVTWNGRTFNSLSVAGGAAKVSVKGSPRPLPTSGWTFWRFKDETGTLQRMNSIRQHYLKTTPPKETS